MDTFWFTTLTSQLPVLSNDLDGGPACAGNRDKPDSSSDGRQANLKPLSMLTSRALVCAERTIMPLVERQKRSRRERPQRPPGAGIIAARTHATAPAPMTGWLSTTRPTMNTARPTTRPPRNGVIEPIHNRDGAFPGRPRRHARKARGNAAGLGGMRDARYG